MAAAVAYSGAAGSRDEYARAAANDDEAWALGKLSAVGVAMSAGRAPSAGRARRKMPLVAVFSRDVAPTAVAPRRQRAPRERATALPAPPSPTPQAAGPPPTQ